MGREVRRVPLDFDWPIRQIWPGFMAGVGDDDYAYCLGKKPEEASYEETVAISRHFGRLIGKDEDWPDCCIPPPSGEGWQLWETVTEGSPVSPVFGTAEELAEWLSTPGNDTSITKGTTKEQWLQFLTNHDWAPSMIMSPTTGLVDGVRGTVQMDREQREVGAAPETKD